MALGQHFDEILTGARAGGDWAWEAIYRDLAPPVLGYLRARGARDPEDLAGEVFLQLVRDLSRFHGDERQFRAWAFTVAHHRLIDDQRYRGRRPIEEELNELVEPYDPAADIEQQVLGRLSRMDLNRIIGRLSQSQQSVILLRVLGDLTIEEVARVLGKRSGAVKALQRRALAAIKRELSREGVTL